MQEISYCWRLWVFKVEDRRHRQRQQAAAAMQSYEKQLRQLVRRALRLWRKITIQNDIRDADITLTKNKAVSCWRRVAADSSQSELSSMKVLACTSLINVPPLFDEGAIASMPAVCRMSDDVQPHKCVNISELCCRH